MSDGGDIMRGRRWVLHIALAVLGGGMYVLIELLWRRRTHVSMFCVGGICFALIGAIHERFRRVWMPIRCGMCAVAVTAVEFVSGCLLNRRWRLNVWDYSDQRHHIMGQVCPLYTFFWGVLSAVAWPVYRRCRGMIERRLIPCADRR